MIHTSENKPILIALKSTQPLLLVGMTAVFLVQLYLSLDWEIQHDTAYLQYVAYLINEHDFLPYRDIFEFNFPATYIFNIVVQHLFGSSQLAFRLLDIILLLTLMLISWAIMRPAGFSTAYFSSVLFGLIYLTLGPKHSLQREFIAVLPLATALLLTTRHTTFISKNFAFLIIGTLCGIAALIKPPLALALPVMVLAICLHSTTTPMTARKLAKSCFKGGIFAFAGFTIPIFLSALWLWKISVLESFVTMVWNYVPLYTHLSGPSLVLSTSHQIAYDLEQLGKFGGYTGLLVGAAFGSYIALDKASTPHVKSLALTLMALVFVTCLFTVIGGRYAPNHWIPFAYFTSLSASFLLSKNERYQDSYASIGIPSIAAIIVVISTAVPVRAVFDQLYFGYPSNPMQHRINVLADYLKANLKEGDSVQPLDTAGGGTARAMLLARAPLATPYIVDFQFYHDVSNPYIQHLRSDFIKRLKEEPPAFIIQSSYKSRPKGLDTSTEFPELAIFMWRCYQLDYNAAGYRVYRRSKSLCP